MELHKLKFNGFFNICFFIVGFMLMNSPKATAENGHDLPERQYIKVAAAQVDIRTGKEIDEVVEFINKAGEDRAELIVFGEYLLGPFYEDYSDAVERVAEAARRHNIYVIIGGWEEYDKGAYTVKKKDRYANTALLFGRDGKIIGKYYKTHAAVGTPPHFWPSKGDEPEWLMKPGDSYPVFQLDFGHIGIMTCYDGYFPESASSLSLNGAEIVVWINGREGSVEDYIVQTDMFRNYSAMIATNLGPGSGTMIGTWPNVILAQATETGSHYITAEIDLKELRWRRANSRTFHQRRPELYKAITQHHKPWKPYEQAGESNAASENEIAPVSENTEVPGHWSEWSKVKIAAGQIYNNSDSLDKMVEFIDQAGADGAELIALPEYILGPFKIPFDDTDPIAKIAEAARRNRIYVAVGGWEEFETGAYAARKKEAYANTVVLFDRQGNIIGKYNKTHRAIGDNPHCWPPKGDELEWLMKAGQGYPTFQLDFARIGIMTCYDGYFSESSSSLSLNGAEIILWINGRPGPIEPFVVQADMYRSYCAMVTTNQGTGSGTMIGTWPNAVLAHITEKGNHYISTEIDLKDLRWRRANSRVFHQRRPKIYGEIVKQHKPWEVYGKKAKD